MGSPSIMRRKSKECAAGKCDRCELYLCSCHCHTTDVDLGGSEPEETEEETEENYG